MRIARRLVISGHVQGVGFRVHVLHAARRAGADGYARNRRDGTVEVVVAGTPEAVAAVESACRTGPRGAAVSDVASEPLDEGDAPAPGAGFDIA